MIISVGAFLNAAGILLGALLGLALRRPISLQVQVFLRSLIGALVFFFGLRLVYESVGGTLFAVLKELFIAFASVILGFWAGKLLRFQAVSNRIGRVAANIVGIAQRNGRPSAADGFNACTILFCAAPLGIIGAMADGLSDYFYLLVAKAFMDSIAMLTFMKLFRWPALLSAIPVFVAFSLISLLCRVYLVPWLGPQNLVAPMGAAIGLVACVVTVVIFEIRKVELANYLPALVIAPLLTKIL